MRVVSVFRLLCSGVPLRTAHLIPIILQLGFIPKDFPLKKKLAMIYFLLFVAILVDRYCSILTVKIANEFKKQ